MVEQRRKVLLGLIHSGACQGMVAPAFDQTLTEAELRGYVRSAFCMRCGEPVSDDQLEAEYA